MAFLAITFYYGAISSSFHFSKTSAWGDAWGGLFLSSVMVLVALESANWLSKKTRVGHLPASLWGFVAAISGTDIGSSFFSLFEISNFDSIVHYTLSGIGTIIFLILFKRIVGVYFEKHHLALTYYLAFTTVNVLNVLYEIGEAIGDKYYGSFNITSRFDTGGDLIFDNLGILTVLLLDFLIPRAIKFFKRAF